MPLPRLLDTRAEANPDQVIFTFLQGGEVEDLTLGGLRQRVSHLAAVLGASAAPGDRVLVLIEPGLDYVVAVWACLWAGLVAVTAYPPDPSRMSRTLPRLLRIVEDADTSVLLTSSLIDNFAAGEIARIEMLHGMARITADRIEGHGTMATPRSGPGPALLQYTSGSTQAARGVMVGHDNVLAQIRLIQDRLALDRPEDVSVMWVPPYHDLGLILGVMKPVYGPGRTVVFPAIEFLARPALWLETMSRYGASFSGGPNFAYDLCVNRVSEADRGDLDLSAWRVAFNGAEPVRATTLRAFVGAYGPAGFRAESFFPGYGLAEATMAISVDEPGTVALEVLIDRGELEQGRVKVVSDRDSVEAVNLVGLGPAFDDHEIQIVDPSSGRVTDAIGEVWVSGPCVAQGYWNLPALTATVFQAELDGHPGRWLRTGDLGFCHEGRLVITGRFKDLVIVRGKKHYPQDVELTAEEAHPLVRKGCGVAFSVDEGGPERLVIVFETRATDPTDLEAIALAIRRSVVISHGVSPTDVILVSPGGVSKTSSGKLQRHETSVQLRNGDLPVLHRSALRAI